MDHKTLEEFKGLLNQQLESLLKDVGKNSL